MIGEIKEFKNGNLITLCPKLISFSTPSSAKIIKSPDDEILVETTKAKGNKCPVCWKISEQPCSRHSV